MTDYLVLLCLKELTTCKITCKLFDNVVGARLLKSLLIFFVNLACHCTNGRVYMSLSIVLGLYKYYTFGSAV